ncbi:glutamine synthetase family protein [Massilioclostridium coli]|uniref:glutamine synthetase family protein n=1 Tax=Massilioclostridium coli TaxID=1870991 RepID=UPI000D7974CE|nr:glutamine synthetase family protein [Massilioclostridium coli]PWM99729.1 MAG: type I glutamate--ammonia ligase [Massilioclostridium sp.]
MYSYHEVMTYCEEEDVKFIRLAFCDLAGNQKNISIMPSELKRAFEYGISFDASAIYGFGNEVKSDLFLFPDPSTLSVLPWRPAQGRVVRMYCDIRYPDGKPFRRDSRYLLKQAIAEAEKRNISCYFGVEFEFYLFITDEEGNPTKIPFDQASYMDIAPEDKGENIRREVCLTLESMGIQPESSHHEEGPGQNEIDFRYSDALSAADNAVTFKSVVKTIAMQNGLYASFSPKPLKNQSGNGMHINISIKSPNGKKDSDAFMAGILKYIREISAYLNPTEESYLRLGEKKAPKYITWSSENRSQLIRIPAAKGEYVRFELRSPDPTTNPYIAYALLIYAGLDGIRKQIPLCEPLDQNLFIADQSVTDTLEKLPANLKEAIEQANQSSLIQQYIPDILD